jgi:hypothetical protein
MMILTLKDLKDYIATLQMPDDTLVGIADDPAKGQILAFSVFDIKEAYVLPASDFPGSKATVVFLPTFGR